MTTPTHSTGVALVLAATRLAAHLAEHSLPEPASLGVETRNMRSEVTVQLRSTTLPTLARDLLTWADTLTTVTVKAWRVPHGERVHLSLASTVSGPPLTIELEVFGLSLASTVSGPPLTIELEVFGGVTHDPEHFADLEPGEHRVIPLAQLRTWASSSPALEQGAD